MYYFFWRQGMISDLASNISPVPSTYITFKNSRTLTAPLIQSGLFRIFFLIPQAPTFSFTLLSVDHSFPNFFFVFFQQLPDVNFPFYQNSLNPFTWIPYKFILLYISTSWIHSSIYCFPDHLLYNSCNSRNKDSSSCFKRFTSFSSSCCVIYSMPLGCFSASSCPFTIVVSRELAGKIIQRWTRFIGWVTVCAAHWPILTLF